MALAAMGAGAASAADNDGYVTFGPDGEAAFYSQPYGNGGYFRDSYNSSYNWTWITYHNTSIQLYSGTDGSGNNVSAMLNGDSSKTVRAYYHSGYWGPSIQMSPYGGANDYYDTLGSLDNKLNSHQFGA